MMSSGLLFYVLTWSPLLVLAIMGSAHDTSLYGAAARFPTAVAIIPTVLVTAVLPGLIASFAHDRAEDGNRLAGQDQPPRRGRRRRRSAFRSSWRRRG